MAESVKNKLVSGVIWESIGQFTSLGIQFIVTVIIARILSPGDFGVIGLLTVFVAISNILVDSGFSQALIQKKEANNTDYSTIFFTNLTVGLLLYILMYIASPYIASFYSMPELSGYARILFLIIPITSLGLVQNVIIQKKLLFKKSAIAAIFAALMSGVIGVVMAYSGFGIMALVAQQLSMYLFRTLGYIVLMRWVPKMTVSFTIIKEMFSFSMNLMFHSLINTTMKNIYTLVIGKYYSTAEVGYYNQANRFEQISASTLTTVIMKVSFPALVQFKEDTLRLKEVYKRVVSMTSFVIAPLMVLLITVAEPLFSILLTDKWLPAVPYFQLLCLYGLTLPVMQICYNIYKLLKKGRMLLVLDSIRHILFLVAIFTTIKYGISVLLIGQFAIMFVMSFVNMYYSGKLISLSVMEQVKSLFPYYAIATVVGVGVWFIPSLNSMGADLIIKSVAFLIAFSLLVFVTKPKAYYEVLTLAKQLKIKLNR